MVSQRPRDLHPTATATFFDAHVLEALLFRDTTVAIVDAGRSRFLFFMGPDSAGRAKGSASVLAIEH
jgi:hypothetical protein